MRNVGRAADSEIWIPMLWPPGIPHVIGHYLENYDLTRDIAQELLNVIDELTEDQIATIPEVGIIDAESYDDGVYQIVKHQDLRFKMDGLHLMEDEETGAVEFSFVSGAHPGYERHEEGDVDGLGLMYLEETAGEAFDVFLESGIDAVIELTPVDDPEESNSVLEFKREYGPKYTWYHLDKFHFTLSSELPPHLEQAQDCSDDGTF
jgi:hypothetical protein